MNFIEKITDGLKLYEVLMLGLGSLMFLVMLAMLIIYAAQKRSLKQLMLFFIIPVVMLGWPSLQKIKIDGTGFEFDKTLAQYEEKPTEENKENVENLIAEIKDRNVKDPNVLKKVALAEFKIGKLNESLKTLDRLPVAEKQDSSVSKLITSIKISDALKNQLKIVQDTPADSSQIIKLNDLQFKAVALDIKNPKLDSTIQVADKKITDYQAVNPRVKLKRPVLNN